MSIAPAIIMTIESAVFIGVILNGKSFPVDAGEDSNSIFPPVSVNILSDAPSIKLCSQIDDMQTVMARFLSGLVIELNHSWLDYRLHKAVQCCGRCCCRLLRRG